MTKKKELSLEELDAVTGGVGDDTYMPEYAGLVTEEEMTESHNPGEKFVVVNKNDIRQWAACRLIEPKCYGTSQYFHTITTKDNLEFDYCSVGTIKAGKRFVTSNKRALYYIRRVR